MTDLLCTFLYARYAFHKTYRERQEKRGKCSK